MEYKGYEVWVSGTTATEAKQIDTLVSIYRNRAVNWEPDTRALAVRRIFERPRVHIRPILDRRAARAA
jgi:hypothetical protein